MLDKSECDLNSMSNFQGYLQTLFHTNQSGKVSTVTHFEGQGSPSDKWLDENASTAPAARTSYKSVCNMSRVYHSYPLLLTSVNSAFMLPEAV